jgi:hypothetical protein
MEERRTDVHTTAWTGDPPGPISREQLLHVLNVATWESRENPDLERAAHLEADQALLDYINDPEVRAAYASIRKRYS